MAFGRGSRRGHAKHNKLDATMYGQETPEPEHGLTTGPWDVADAPTDDAIERIDLGPLQVPAIEGCDLRVEVTPEGQLVSVTLAGSGGDMQIGVFAAPRSEEIWPELRTELLASIASQGGTGQIEDGEFGREIRAKVRADTGQQQLRFVGVDGPRWFLRAVVSGPAATDPRAMAPFATAIRQCIVDRGADPMPVREPLPLRLPKDVAEQIAAQQEADGDDAAAE
jgi:hypothetical protein